MSTTSWIGIAVGLVAGLVGWVLVAPMALLIDTSEARYAFRWRGLLMARLTVGGRVHLWVLGWSRVVDPWPSKARPASPSRRPHRRRPSWRRMIRVAWAVGRTFRLRTCQVDLDTGDYVLNAYLYPVFARLSGRNRRLRIGFNGEANARIVVENRLYRMLFAFLRSYFSR